MTWSVRRLCSSNCSFTSRFQICDRTHIRWVVVTYGQSLSEISGFLITTQRILVGSQIWDQVVKERLELLNICTDHVTIQSELKYLLEPKMWCWNAGFLVVKPAQLQWSGFSYCKACCNGSVPVPTLTRNRSSWLELLVTLQTVQRHCHLSWHCRSRWRWIMLLGLYNDIWISTWLVCDDRGKNVLTVQVCTNLTIRGR